jgi:hypothetical protein
MAHVPQADERHLRHRRPGWRQCALPVAPAGQGAPGWAQCPHILKSSPRRQRRHGEAIERETNACAHRRDSGGSHSFVWESSPHSPKWRCGRRSAPWRWSRAMTIGARLATSVGPASAASQVAGARYTRALSWRGGRTVDLKPLGPQKGDGGHGAAVSASPAGEAPPLGRHRLSGFVRREAHHDRVRRGDWAHQYRPRDCEL